MLAPIIPFLYLLIWIAIGAGCVYAFFWFLSDILGIALPARLVKIIWGIFVLLVLIAIIRFLAYGGGLPLPGVG